MRPDYVRHQLDLDAYDYAQLDAPAHPGGGALVLLEVAFRELARCIDTGPPWSADREVVRILDDTIGMWR
jgi:hypothetical protein